MATRVITILSYVFVALCGTVLAIFTVVAQNLRYKVSAIPRRTTDVQDIDCIMFKVTVLGFILMVESILVGLVGFFATVLRLRRVENVMCFVSILVVNGYFALTLAFNRRDPLLPEIHPNNPLFYGSLEHLDINHRCKEIIGWSVDPLVLMLFLMCYLRVFQSTACILYLRNSSVLPYYFINDN